MIYKWSMTVHTVLSGGEVRERFLEAYAMA